MVKNFITLGDAAFDANDAPMGIIRFTPDNVSNWKNIALEQLKSVKTERLSNYAKQQGYVDIWGDFNANSHVTQADFDDFCEQVATLFEVKLSFKKLDISKYPENSICLSFTNINFDDVKELIQKSRKIQEE